MSWFKRKRKEPSKGSKSQKLDAVVSFVTAPTLRACRQVVDSRGDELLAGDVDKDFLAIYMMVRSKPDKVRELKERYALLMRCRREGVSAAFRNPARPADMEDTFLDKVINQVSSEEKTFQRVLDTHQAWRKGVEADRKIRREIQDLQKAMQKGLEANREIRRKIQDIQEATPKERKINRKKRKEIEDLEEYLRKDRKK